MHYLLSGFISSGSFITPPQNQFECSHSVVEILIPKKEIIYDLC